MSNTSSQLRPTSLLAFVCGAAMAAAANAQVFTLDDILNTAEDPYDLGLPAMIEGWVGPSPSMPYYGYTPGMLLGPRIGQSYPPHLAVPIGGYIDAVSTDKPPCDPYQGERCYLEFSVDRITTGVFGSPLWIEAGFYQQMGDMYITLEQIPHPAAFIGDLKPGLVPEVPTFGGVLSSTGPGGAQDLAVDESQFGLTSSGEPGLLDPAGTPTPVTGPGNKDNINAWNRDPIDFNGDQVADVPFFYSVSPLSCGLNAYEPADIYVARPKTDTEYRELFAAAPMLGLDWFGHRTDDIDALVVWDDRVPGPPNRESAAAEPLVDYALFSLAPGSAMLAALVNAGVPATPASIFFTDFSGSFGLFAFETDLGVAPYDMLGGLNANVDALDFVPIRRGDIDGNAVLNIFDFLAFQGAFGNGDRAADFNGDGRLNVFDFLQFQADFSNGG